MSVNSVGIQPKSSKKLQQSTEPKEVLSQKASKNYSINITKAFSNSSSTPTKIKKTCSRLLFDENLPEDESYSKSTINRKSTVPMPILTESINFLTTSRKNSKDPSKTLFLYPESGLSQPDLSSNLSQLSISSSISSSGSQSSREQYKKTIKSPIRYSISQYDQVYSMSFEEVLYWFKNSKQETFKNLWKKSLFSKFKKCWDKNRLEDENLDVAEQIIKFSLTEFSVSENFHLSLVKSVQNATIEYKEVRFDDIYSAIFKNKYPLISLLCFLFLNRYFKAQVCVFFETCEALKDCVVNIAFALTSIAVNCLRKGRLNPFINQCNKGLEVFCFFYAGLVIYWNENYLSIGKKNRDNASVLRQKLSRFIRSNIYNLIKTAEILYE